MQEQPAAGQTNMAELFRGAMILIGIFVLARYAGEVAYAFGKFVSAS